jgi:hypothetical protein
MTSAPIPPPTHFTTILQMFRFISLNRRSVHFFQTQVHDITEACVERARDHHRHPGHVSCVCAHVHALPCDHVCSQVVLNDVKLVLPQIPPKSFTDLISGC